MSSMKALMFGKKSTHHENDKSKLEVIELHKKINVLYKQLTEENDNFIDKRLAYEADINALTSKKNEVDNRLQYLSGVKLNMKEKLNVSALDLKELKDLCQTYVLAFSDMETVENEIHVLELEIATVYTNWDNEKKNHDIKVGNIKKQIDDIQIQITELSE
jgi:uncharacterized coiled-coil DUF342 family protein